ncbi:hypothetical protein METHPM2_990008 [Pseudomonas sp. PM2]
MIEHHQHQPGAEQHAHGGADFGAAGDDLAIAPVGQDRPEQAVVFQPGAEARRAFGGGPGGEQDEFGGGQPRYDNRHQADPQADVGQQAEQELGDFGGGLGFAGHVAIFWWEGLHIVSHEMHSNVGAGLPAIAVHQVKHVELTHRHRRQASSHIEPLSTGILTPVPGR